MPDTTTPNRGFRDIARLPQLAPRRATYHHRALREALIDTALLLTVERNGPDFSLRELAARIGVQHPSVYRHFADKGHLLKAIAVRGFQQLHKVQLEAIAGKTDPYEILMAIGRAHVIFCLGNPGLFKLIFESAEPTLVTDVDVAEARAASGGLFLDAIVRCQAAGLLRADPPEAIRIILWAASHGLCHLLISGNIAQLGPLPLPLEVLIERALLAPLDGLLVTPSVA